MDIHELERKMHAATTWNEYKRLQGELDDKRSEQKRKASSDGWG